MFTFKTQPKQDPLFFIGNKPVFTKWKKTEEDRIPPYRNTSDYLGSDEFRERYNLTKKEASALKTSLENDEVPEDKLKTKFYSVRKSLNSRLYTEIDLRGTDHEIEWRFPADVKAWPTTSIVIGSSGSGKTFLVLKWIEEALKRRKKFRRKFIYVSPELQVDTTLKKIINNRRYEKYFEGIDVSDEAFEEFQQTSAGATVDMWWDSIKSKLIHAPAGTCIVLDDAPDSKVHHYLQGFLTKWLRTGRHKRVGVTSIQHRIRGAKWTSQSFSSVKHVFLGVRGGARGTLVSWIYEQLGIPMRRARELIEIFAETGRFMCVHQWAPAVLFNEKFAIWV